jgi:hypothetical protein
MSDKESAPASRDARPAVHPAAPGPHTAAGQRTTADQRTTAVQRTAAVHPAAPLVAIGIICGIAWAAGFRSYMVELVGPASTFSWWGTFGAILLPGAIAGGLLGWAEALRRAGGRRGWRWLALAPLALAIAPLIMPGAVAALLTEGLGGGAIAVSLMGIGGGYALSRRGPLWARLVCGLVSAALAAALVLAGPGIAGARLAFTEPRGAWFAVLTASFIVVLALASSIPHRTARSRDHTTPDRTAQPR